MSDFDTNLCPYCEANQKFVDDSICGQCEDEFNAEPQQAQYIFTDEEEAELYLQEQEQQEEYMDQVRLGNEPLRLPQVWCYTCTDIPF